MATEYNYYLAYRTKDNKIIPFDLKKLDGTYRSIYCHCSSNDPIYEYFKEFKPTDEIDPEFENQLIPNKDDFWSNRPGIAWMPVDQLPEELPIRNGYFLIDDVLEYQKCKYYTDGMFESMITPEVYAQLAARQLEFGYIKDDDDSYYSKNASDYIYFSAIDYESKDYAGYLIREIAERLTDYTDNRDHREVIIVGQKN